MHDIVIPLKKDDLDNIELKYTLRSICKFMPDHGQIFIIGHYPDFVSNAVHISVSDQKGSRFKQRNIYNKLITACNDNRVSDSFIYFAGDEYLLRTYKSVYYQTGTLQQSLTRYNESQSYGVTIANTYNHLQGGYDFDNHWPILISKELFTYHVSRLPWHVAYGFGHKSIYCNRSGIIGPYFPMPKIKQDIGVKEIKELISNAPGFSTQEKSFNDSVLSVLNELFPQKCIYEL